MLTVIYGKAGSGKTKLLYEKLEKAVSVDLVQPLLIVPEQFSFITERKLLKMFGAPFMRKIKIAGFSRLALSELKKEHAVTKPFVSDGIRLALMSKTLEALSDELDVFKNFRKYPSSVASLLSFEKEMKLCGLKSSDMYSAALKTEDKLLKNKITELSLICETFDAVVEQSYFDDSNAIACFNESAVENSFFKGKSVFIDSFRSFSACEAETVKLAIEYGKDVYVTLCTDASFGEDGPFTFVDRLLLQLKSLAEENGQTVELICSDDSTNRFSADIAQIEKGVFQQEIQSVPLCGDFSVVSCADREEECQFVAGEIKRLLRSGKYRCRDIIVVERNEGTYKRTLINTFNRFGIPVFDDSRRPMSVQSLFVYIDAVLSAVADGFSSESFFAYLKSGLSPLTFDETALIEKYALIWNINGKTWQNPFTMHPDGFGREMTEEATARVSQLEELRKKAVLPLLSLKKRCDGIPGEEIARVIYQFVVENKVSEKLYDLCQELEEDSFLLEAQRESRSWESFIGILDSMANLVKGETVTLSRWHELFSLLVSAEEMGEIPQGLDEVTVASADRMRTEGVKVAFIVGVNRDEFPRVQVSNSVLTDRDRRNLLEIGLGVRPPFEVTAEEERFIVYCALTAPSERLFLTYKTTSSDGECAPSPLIDELKNLFTQFSVFDYHKADLLKKSECGSSAFSELAKCYDENSTNRASLLSLFAETEEYRSKLQAIERLIAGKNQVFADSENAQKLFGNELRISASKIEDYYTCPFRYFCRYGIKAKPLTKATFDPAQSGTVVHFVLENLIRHFGAKALISTPDEALEQYIKELLSSYIKEKLGGVDDKSSRFLFLFGRLTEIVMTIVTRLKGEFAVCDFEPIDFELPIGGEKVSAYSAELDEGSVCVTGFVDRVDMMEKDGIKYVRIIDYKTGKKDFKLSKLLYGLNIQMVLYLLTIEKNGKGIYRDVLPAGVLYLPSRIGFDSFLNVRSPSKEETDAQKRAGGKLSGMILSSPVVMNGMGVSLYPDYLPASYGKKDNEPIGNVYSLKQFRLISNMVEERIINMGNALHRGEIPILPISHSGKAQVCEYCDYRTVCGFENGDPCNEVVDLKHGQVLEGLEAGENGDTVEQ